VIICITETLHATNFKNPHFYFNDIFANITITDGQRLH